jgi:hypothetical protein
VCHVVGRFSVRGHAGLNRVRFIGRVRGKQLGAGTYRISARARGEQALVRVTIVVVAGGAPTREQLAAARASNVCSATRGIASTVAVSGASNAGGANPEQVERSFQPKGEPSASGHSEGSDSRGGVLGSGAVERTAEAIRPVLVALLGLAILLLAFASLPRVAVPDPRFHEVLARHRLDIALAGSAALVAVVIAFLLG